MFAPFFILQSDIDEFIAKDGSLPSLNSIVGVKKRFAGGRSRVINRVNEDSVKEALGTGVKIVKIAHVPRSWLRYPEPSAIESAQPILYG